LCGLLGGRSLTGKGTQTVRVHHIESRPHVQGASRPLRLRHSIGELTDGGGLLRIRRMWDQLGIGAWLESHTREIGGNYRCPLMVEVWVILLLYGGGAMKQGQPSHHPLVAFSADSGDCLGVMWRPGSAHTAAGSIEWLRQIVARLRGLGVHDITVRMDKGFFSKEMVHALADMDVRFFLKVPRHSWVRSAAGAWRASAKDTDLWTATGELYGVRLLACEWRTFRRAAMEGQLALDSYHVERDAFIFTNDPAIHALTAWWTYNEGALV
jgi:hypothetical protein